MKREIICKSKLGSIGMSIQKIKVAFASSNIGGRLTLQTQDSDDDSLEDLEILIIWTYSI